MDLLCFAPESFMYIGWLFVDVYVLALSKVTYKAQIDPRYSPYGTHMGCPYGTHMEPVCTNHMGPIWAAHMGPIL